MNDKFLKQFKVVEMTHVFRKLRDLSQGDFIVLYSYFNHRTEFFTNQEAQKLQALTKAYIDLIHLIVERGESNNPYAQLKALPLDYIKDALSDFKDYKTHYNYLIDTLIPRIVGERYFAIIKYDFIGDLAPIQFICRDILSFSQHDLKEVFEVGMNFITRLEATIFATADYEKQVFG